MKIGEFDFSRRTGVMGILNITPDSFSDGGRFIDPERALDRALAMESEGADLIDVGGESTRPGSDPVPVEEELRRLVPVLKKLKGRLKIPISLDTRNAAVARAGLDEGVAMINDISALSHDSEMSTVVARTGVPVILMHMKGRPKDMQTRVSYDDVVGEVLGFLKERITAAEKLGIAREKILLDPGIGFGKSVKHNLEILRRLEEFCALGLPVVIGASKKSFLGEVLGKGPQERVEGGLAVSALATWAGVGIVRTHDVRQTVDVVKVVCAVKEMRESR